MRQELCPVSTLCQGFSYLIGILYLIGGEHIEHMEQKYRINGILVTWLEKNSINSLLYELPTALPSHA